MSNDQNAASKPQDPAQEAAGVSTGEKVPGKPEHPHQTQPAGK